VTPESEVKIFAALAAPLGLISSVITPIFFVYAHFKDLEKGGPGILFRADSMFALVISATGFLFCLWYCRAELGWFSGAKKRNPRP
jgi:hypothetical protein